MARLAKSGGRGFIIRTRNISGGDILCVCCDIVGEWPETALNNFLRVRVLLFFATLAFRNVIRAQPGFSCELDIFRERFFFSSLIVVVELISVRGRATRANN